MGWLISLLLLAQHSPKFLKLLWAHSGWPRLFCSIYSGWKILRNVVKEWWKLIRWQHCSMSRKIRTVPVLGVCVHKLASLKGVPFLVLWKRIMASLQVRQHRHVQWNQQHLGWPRQQKVDKQKKTLQKGTLYGALNKICWARLKDLWQARGHHSCLISS